MTRSRRAVLTALPDTPDDGNMATYDITRDRRQRADDIVEEVGPQLLDPSPHQHRKSFDTDGLLELGRSFGPDGRGLNHPPLVRPKADGRFEIVAGERRVRAAAAVGLAKIRVHIREMSDEEARAATAVENLIRRDLLPWEEAHAFLDLQQLVREKSGNAGAGARAVEAFLEGATRKSTVSRYIRIAMRIPVELLSRAGGVTPDGRLDGVVLAALTVDQLEDVARVEEEEERIGRLGHIIKQIRSARNRHVDGVQSLDTDAPEKAAARPKGNQEGERSGGKIDPCTGDECSPYVRARDHGYFRKNLRTPVCKLSPAEAGQHLADVLPTVVALAERSGAAKEGRLPGVDGAPLALLAVPHATSATTPREALSALIALEKVVTVAARELLAAAGESLNETEERALRAWQVRMRERFMAMAKASMRTGLTVG